LFLTEAIDRNIDNLAAVFNWFDNILTIISADANCLGLEIMVAKDKYFTDFLGKFLKISGVGIDSVTVEEVEMDIDRNSPNIPDEVRRNVLKKFDESDSLQSVILANSQGEYFIISREQKDHISLLQLKTMHIGEDNRLIDFAMEEESEGTQRLIHLAPAIFMLQEEFEKVIFLDELDRRLHPLLSHCFLKSLISCRGKDNQIIFTTHDTNILDLDIFRRDEIWFVEKNQQGASTLYSLAEFKIRPDLKLEKGYLAGRFGAIPFFGDPQKLGWLKEPAIPVVG
jgi:uncharacterized protein